MHADLKVADEGDELNRAIDDSVGMDPVVRHGHSLLDVLRPATPPQPKNARVIRLFDVEAGGYDTKPEGEAVPHAAPVPEVAAPADAKREPRARDAERDARRLSLRAAAGLF